MVQSLKCKNSKTCPSQDYMFNLLNLKDIQLLLKHIQINYSINIGGFNVVVGTQPHSPICST